MALLILNLYWMFLIDKHLLVASTDTSVYLAGKIVLLGYIWGDIEDLLEKVLKLFSHSLIHHWLDILWYLSNLVAFLIDTYPIFLIKYVFCNSEHEFRHFLAVHWIITIDAFGLLQHDNLLALCEEFIEVEFSDGNGSFFADNMEGSLGWESGVYQRRLLTPVPQVLQVFTLKHEFNRFHSVTNWLGPFLVLVDDWK